MANRTVKVELQAGTAGYTPPIQAATAATKDLAAAQKESATSAKGAAEATASSTSANVEAARQTRLLTNAKREAAAAAKEATAADTEATRALTAAQKEAAAAAKDTTEFAAERQAAADAAVQAAQKEAEAAAAAKAASVTQAKAAADALAAHRDETAAARENAAEEAAAAKASEDAAAKRQAAYKGTSKVALTAGAVLAGAFVVAEKATSDFDKSLSTVAAVGGKEAVARLGELRGAALQAGKDTAFTATEAANAEGELVKAGVSVSDVLNGALKGSLSLAAAGNLGLADAATISANAMNTFGLKGQDVAHIADVYAAAANKSAADVQTLAYAMQQGGLVAAQTGLSFEDTTAILAAFADRGLEGADAGTSMKTMLEKLNAPTTQAASLMQQLGIVTYDAQGKFVGITQFAGELHDKLGALTDAQRNQALATIFGSDAIRAASVLYNLGADGVKGYTQAVNDQGAAGRMAAEQMNNLSGDLKQLKGSIDTALIKGGSGANDVLRSMTQNATAAVNAFASLPKPLQEVGVELAGGVGSSLLLVGALTSLGGKLGSTKKTLAEVSEASTGMKGALASAGSFMIGPWGLAVAGATAVIGTFISKHKEAKVVVTDFTDAIKQDGNALGQTTTQAVSADLAHKGLFDTFSQLGVSSKTVTDAALGQKNALDQVAASIQMIGKATGNDPMKMAKYIEAIKTVDAYSGAINGQLKAQQQATAAAEDSTAATGTSAAEQAKAAQTAKDAAAATFAQAAGQRALADAQRTGADTTKVSTGATKDHAAAKTDDTAATNAAAAAAKAHDAATKSDTTSQKDAATAAKDKAKADAASKDAADAAAKAESLNGAVNSTAAERKKANADAASKAAKATRDQATADNAASRASDAASRAADKHTAANDKSAKASKDAADAAAKQAKATSDSANQAAADAEASREATEVHKLGTTWLLAVADAESQASGSAQDLDDSVKGEVGAMKDAQTQASTLKDALDALNGVHISAGKAALTEQQKVADLTKALYDNGKTLDITTDAGRKNMTAIYDLADAANAHAQAVAQESGSIQAGDKALDASRQEFDAVLKQAGLTTDQIEQFNRTLLNTPKLATVMLDVQANTAPAEAELNALAAKYAGIVVGGGPQGKKYFAAYATGGLVNGAGGPTSDSNLVAVSNKEYIVNAAAVARPGVRAALDALNFGGGATSVVKPMVPMHSIAAGGGAYGGGGTSTVQVELVSSGSDEYLLRFLRHAINVRGGDVQKVLGRT